VSAAVDTAPTGEGDVDVMTFSLSELMWSRAPPALFAFFDAVAAELGGADEVTVEVCALTVAWLASPLDGAAPWSHLGRCFLCEPPALAGVELPGADLSGGDLSRFGLPHAVLTGARLGGADLREADLRGSHLSGADLSRASANYCRLANADLSGAGLGSASLIFADLSWADLRGADLSWADLRGADLSGAWLDGADLTGARLTTALRRPDDPPLPGWSLNRHGRLAVVP